MTGTKEFEKALEERIGKRDYGDANDYTELFCEKCNHFCGYATEVEFGTTTLCEKCFEKEFPE